MDTANRKKVPVFVVPTSNPKKMEETTSVLDGMWACLLNDYLENLGDSDEGNASSSSSRDANSISTTALRAERRRLKKMRKQEKRTARLKALAAKKYLGSHSSTDGFSNDVDDQLFERLDSSVYSEGGLLDIASKKLSSTESKKNPHDKYEALRGESDSKILPQERTMEGQSEPSVRPTLEPEAAKPTFPAQGWSKTKSHTNESGRHALATSSIDADGWVAGNGWKGNQSSTDPLCKKPQANRREMKEHSKSHIDDNGIVHVDLDENFAEMERNHQSIKRHSRRVLLSSKTMVTKRNPEKQQSFSQRSKEVTGLETWEPRDSISPQSGQSMPMTIQRQYDGISRNEMIAVTCGRIRSTEIAPFLEDESAYGGSRLPGIEQNPTNQKTRDYSQSKETVWALTEDKRSELHEIRQKKLDRKEALLRIRAIKARIAKLET